MKKTINFLLLLLLTATAFAQQLPPIDRTRTNQVLDDRATWSRYFMGVPHGLTPGFPAYVPDSLKCGALFYKVSPGVDTVLMSYNCLSSTWTKVGAGAPVALVPGGPVTTLPAVGFNPGTSLTPTQAITAMFYGTQVPTAALTGGTVYELTASNKTHSLSWTYGRQSATATIATAVITPGTFNVFGSQPAQPGTVSGTQSVTTTANTNTTYTFTVTTSDGKTATATTTDTFLPRFFYGRCTGTAPTSTEILAFAGGGNPLSNTHAGGPITITASGSNYFFFSYLASQGAVTLITDGSGFNVTSSFNLTTVSLTNSQGYTATYNIYTHNAATSGNYTLSTN